MTLEEPNFSASLAAAVSGGKNSFYFYTAIAAFGFLCFILLGLWRFRKNMRKRDDAYRQWVEYEDARREGRTVDMRGANAMPAHLTSQKRVPGLELGEMGSSKTVPAIHNNFLFSRKAPPLADTGRISETGEEFVGDEAEPKRISQMQIDTFYSGQGAQQLRELDRHSEVQAEAAAFGLRAPPTLPKAKSPSIFGKFNPLITGRLSAEAKSKSKPVNAAVLGGAVNPMAINANTNARRLQFVSTPASPEGLPAGLASPTQSPELIDALDSIKIEETEFDDDEEDEED